MLTASILPLLLTGDALAWNHTQLLWNREDMPLEWWMSDYAEDSLPGMDYQIRVIEDSFNNWVEDASCAELSHAPKGVRDGHHGQGHNSSDRMNTFYFDDPLDQQGGGILGVAYTDTDGELAFNRNGMNYYYATDSDIVFSKGIDWGTTEDIANGQCNGEKTIEGVATHEIGHLWGMDHSCEETDVNAGDCNDAELLNAVMFWTAGPDCSLSQTDFTTDDLEGITALYGPYATFSPTTETRGGVPLEVCFSLTSNSAIEEAEWLFGDGQTGTELEPCHTYTEQGQYTINVTIRGSSETCDEWEYTERERAMVVVCEPPQAADGFDGMFTYERSADDDNEDEGTLVYQMINQVDTSVYGCIEQAQWDIFKGDELIQSVQSWSPKIAFPGEGTYRVVLNLGGPGGIAAEELTIDVTEDGGVGCSVVGSGAGLAGLLAGLLGVSLRRRRK